MFLPETASGPTEFFKGRELVIASMHGKEKVLAPLFQSALNVNTIVPRGLNTDRLGTFTGEVERLLSPLEAARQKCLDACALTGQSLAVANEGSFGPHPNYFFVPADEEIIVMVDLEHDLEFKVKELSTDTNFSAKLCRSYEEVEAFAKTVFFPSHALVLRDRENSSKEIIKGVRTQKKLEELVENYFNKYGQVFLETDMRAMHNPTRMSVIEKAGAKMVNLLEQACPSCNTPGFDVIKVLDGLPCSQCGSPTQSIAALIFGCQACGKTLEKRYPKGKTHEDPMYCNWCNP